MPAGAIEHQRPMRLGANAPADLIQVAVHGRLVRKGKYQADPDGPRRADRAEQIGPGIAPVTRRARARAPLGPQPCQPTLLADPGFVLEPDLERFAGGMFGQGRAHQGGKVF